MSALRQQVLYELTQAQGSVQAVMAVLPSVSRSYVNKIKQEEWEPGEVHTHAVTTPQDFTNAILPPNIEAVASLRNDTITKLKERIADGIIEDAVLQRILKTILAYETQLRRITQPALNVFQDNRVQANNISVEVQALAQQVAANLSQEDLRSLAGVDEPINIIDGEMNERP